MSSRSARSAGVALGLLVLVWAYSWIVMKQAMRYAGPFDFSALRYLGGAAVLFLILLVQRQSLRPPPLALTVLIGLSQTTGFQGLSQWALVSGGAGHVSLLSYTMPFWVVLIAWPILRERPTKAQWLSLVLAGAACIAHFWRLAAVSPGHSAPC